MPTPASTQMRNIILQPSSPHDVHCLDVPSSDNSHLTCHHESSLKTIQLAEDAQDVPHPDIPPLIFTHNSPLPLLRCPENVQPAGAVVDPFDEPVIIAPNFELVDPPDPIFPQVSGIPGAREPLPFIPPCPLKCYVVIKGYKIGIFLEKWYIHNDLLTIHHINQS